VCLSSGLSGSYNSARIAASDLREKYPERKIYIVDSLAASSGFGLIIDKLADLRDEGKDIDFIYNWVEENKLKMHLWFFSTDLTFYVKGGRISRAAGLFGTALKLCPLLNMDANGKLIARSKIRGKAKVIEAIVERMIENAEGKEKYDGKCFISHSACQDDAKAVSDLIVKKFPKLCGKPEIFSIGTTIGSHTGPGTVAVFFWGDKREL
jgi:DegV family protein with EDD domain